MQRPKHISKKPGVYIFRNIKQKPLYIGKAGNLKKRLVSYWRRDAPPKVLQLVREAKTFSWQEAESEIEALILEAQLIKQYRPKYNVLMRDDKNYFFVVITRETFPRVFITHQPHQIRNSKFEIRNKFKIRNSKPVSDFVLRASNFQYVGPFTGWGTLKTTLRLLRRIFPYCTCKAPHKRPCLNAEIGRCPGFCCSKISSQLPASSPRRAVYAKNIKNITAVLQGKKQRLLAELKKRMREAAQKQNYEQAARLRDQVAGLEDVFAHKTVLELPRAKSNWPALERKLRLLLGAAKPIQRIESYDISNISGTDASGSMVVFTNGKPDKKEYRMFKIKTVRGANDPAMIGEVIARRLRHKEWRLPDLIVIDGGKPQFNAAQLQIARGKEQIVLTALAKREEELYAQKRSAPIPLKTFDREILHLFQAVRDEAHRFAKKYHHTLREEKLKNIA